MTIGALAAWPPQLTRTVPVPGLVFPPIVHDQEAVPEPSALFAVRPAAVLAVPAGVV